MCKRTLICLEKKELIALLFSYINTPSTLIIVHPPTPNNRYNNALKSFEITDNSKAATLKNNSLCTEDCGLPWNT